MHEQGKGLPTPETSEAADHNGATFKFHLIFHPTPGFHTPVQGTGLQPVTPYSKFSCHGVIYMQTV